jgi:non-canonical purine NTP pyrophosphatase (RdgB/HAM1 family)
LRQLLIGTANAGKVREFREMLGGARDDCASSAAEPFELSDLSGHSGVVAIEETGDTFLANACLKAAGYARQFDTWALADDSGLEVDALDGAPGVSSARWAKRHEAGEGDAANNALLLRQLDAVPDGRRTGRFVCVLALADPKGRIILTARDTVEGQILRSPRGSNGFGYDPLFYIDSLRKTTAELSPAEKHAVSHRGKALRRMRTLMERTGLA